MVCQFITAARSWTTHKITGSCLKINSLYYFTTHSFIKEAPLGIMVNATYVKEGNVREVKYLKNHNPDHVLDNFNKLTKRSKRFKIWSYSNGNGHMVTIFIYDDIMWRTYRIPLICFIYFPVSPFCRNSH